MEAILNWVRQITCYLIFTTAVSNLIREQSYQKYVRLVMGMILILILAEPVFHVLDNMDRYQLNLEKYLAFEQDFDTAAIERAGIRQTKELLANVRELIRKDIVQLAEQSSFTVEQVEIRMEEEIGTEQFGMVKEIRLFLSGSETTGNNHLFESPELILFREELAAKLGVVAEKIQITLN